MKIFSWMQSKVSGKQRSKTQNSSVAANKRVLQESSKEEFSDWPQGLLAIGTFGNNNVTEELDKRSENLTEASCEDHLNDITPEEVEELQKELNLIVDKQEVECNSLVEQDTSLESFRPRTRNISKTGRQLQLSNSHLDSSTSNDIGKKSVSFLFKKMLLCGSGFSPTPSLRDPFPESIHKKSRMKEILRTILSKKIYPQSSSPKASSIARKYLENKQFCMTDSDSEDEMSDQEANDGSKWVKTDSEYIVLEI